MNIELLVNISYGVAAILWLIALLIMIGFGVFEYDSQDTSHKPNEKESDADIKEPLKDNE